MFMRRMFQQITGRMNNIAIGNYRFSIHDQGLLTNGCIDAGALFDTKHGAVNMLVINIYKKHSTGSNDLLTN